MARNLRVPVTEVEVGGAMLPDDTFGMKLTFQTGGAAQLEVVMSIDLLDRLLKQAKEFRPAARAAARYAANA